MPPATPYVRRLVFLWGALWLLVSLSRLGGGSGLLAVLELDFTRLLSGDWLALPGVLAYSLAHEPFPGVLHLALNAYLLWLFGPEVENLYPGRRFLRFLLFAALAGAAVHLLLHLTVGGPFQYAVIGGSGLVMAVLAVNAAVYPGLMLNLIFLRVSLLTFFLALLILDALGFLYSLSGQPGAVAVDVHLAGAGFGWWWARGPRRRRGPLQWLQESWQQRRRAEQQRRAGDEEQELDRILAKISRDGLPSLSREERAFLEKRSRKRG